MKRALLICMALLFAAPTAFAQDRTITGKVTDENGEPLPGVSVQVSNTTAGTSTDLEGNYEVLAPQDAETLVFSFLGYNSLEESIGGRNLINVTLTVSLETLDEVIITGQGIGIEKKRLSTTVEVVSSEQLEAVPNVALDQLIQAQLPGAQIRLNSGQPGTAALIRSRGIVSANTSATPVIYVDGVRVDNLNTETETAIDIGGSQSSSIPDIPVENIERIEFIKGGAATTLYGSDAANGVIQIFTKKGQAGKPEVDFEVELGSSTGTKNFLKYSETADILFDPGLVQSYRLGLSGGKDRTTYSFSGNIYQNDGFRPNNVQKRYNFRTNLSANLTDALTYNGSFGFSANQFGRDQNANSSFSSFSNLETGAFGDLSTFNQSQLDSVRMNFIDPVQETVSVNETIRRFQTSQSFVLKPLSNLTAKAMVGIDARNSEQKLIQTNAYLIALGTVAEGTNDQGVISVAERNFIGLSGDLNIQHIAEVKDFSFISTLGSQVFRDIDRQKRLNATNVGEGSGSVNNSAEVSGRDFEQVVVNYGFFAAENIGYKDKLFLELGIRFDGNTAFGDEVGLQSYPKVGLAYDIASEPFFNDFISKKILPQLKLRANYGRAGNFPAAFANDKTLDFDPYLGQPALSLGQPGDPDLRPEKVETYEGGVDLALLDYKITLSATYYDATTKDALFLAPFSPSFGFQNQLRNIGEISNKGWEFSGVFNVLDKSDYRLRFNASYNLLTESVVVSSGGSPEFALGGFTFLGSFVKEGLPVGYLRGNQPTFDSEGNLVDSEPNAFLGNPIPKHSGILGLSFTYKNRLTLFANADYQMGAQGVNVDEVLRFFNGLSDDRIPEPSLGASFFDLAGVWVEDTDYLKVRNVSLQYSLPDKLFQGIVKGVDVGFTMTNPLNFASSKFDPEVTGAGANSQGGVTVGGFGFSTESPAQQYLGSLRVRF